MSIFSKVAIREMAFIPMLNTGTSLDIATGAFVPGVNNTILNGGLTFTNGTTGRPKMFKSTCQINQAINAYARYPGCDMWLHDSESTQQKARVLRMATVVPSSDNEFKLSSGREYYAEDLLEALLVIAEERIKHRKDYLVESPFLDNKTGKARLIMRPFIFGVDSWSALMAKTIEDGLLPDVKVTEDGEIVSKSSITSKDTLMTFAHEGLAKKKIIRELTALTTKASIYMFTTAHVGDKIEMNPHSPSPRALQHMKYSDKPKGVGAEFMFLMQNILDCTSASLLQHDDKTCLYPSKVGIVGDNDLNQVVQVVTSGKNNGSGSKLKHVVSQTNGILPELSHYQFLKDRKYWGMAGSNQRHAPVLLPDEQLQRTTVYDKLRSNPKLARALEILMQLCFIQEQWTLNDMPVPFNITPEQLMDKLSKSTYAVDDILNSRGWWTYEYNGWYPNQPYMSLYDILSIVK